MSLESLSAVLAMRDISDKEFRFLVWIAESDSGDSVAVRVDRLVELTGHDEKTVRSFIERTVLKWKPLRSLVIQETAHGACVIGAVHWSELAEHAR